MSTSKGRHLNRRIPPFSKKGTICAIVETPRNKRNKYYYDESLGVFRLGKVLAAGEVFPFDFGFIPGTLGGDGDPLDVLLLMDEAAFPGCLVDARPIGVIEAEQIENGQSLRNDRIIAVASEAHQYSLIKSLEELNPQLVEEVKHFFVTYQQLRGVEFRPLATRGPIRAKAIIDKAIRAKKHRTRKATK